MTEAVHKICEHGFTVTAVLEAGSKLLRLLYFTYFTHSDTQTRKHAHRNASGPFRGRSYKSTVIVTLKQDCPKQFGTDRLAIPRGGDWTRPQKICSLKMTDFGEFSAISCHFLWQKNVELLPEVAICCTLKMYSGVLLILVEI